MNATARLIFAAGAAAIAVPACAATPAAVYVEPMYVSYPKDAFAAKQEGRVAVELRISATGSVEECRVVQGVAASLDEASCNYWRRTQFHAAYDDKGQPVESTLQKFSDWRLR